jgi:hypothetical protein
VELGAAMRKAELCGAGAYIEVVTDKYVAPLMAMKLPFRFSVCAPNMSRKAPGLDDPGVAAAFEVVFGLTTK